MSVTRYLILMSMATLLCLFAFVLILYHVDPVASNSLGLVLFYLSLFFFSTGLLSLLGFLGRYFFNKNQFITEQVIISFRQAILFSILLVVGLYLQSKDLVSWWNLLILLILLVAVEYAFICADKHAKNIISR